MPTSENRDSIKPRIINVSGGGASAAVPSGRFPTGAAGGGAKRAIGAGTRSLRTPLAKKVLISPGWCLDPPPRPKTPLELGTRALTGIQSSKKSLAMPRRNPCLAGYFLRHSEPPKTPSTIPDSASLNRFHPTHQVLMDYFRTSSVQTEAWFTRRAIPSGHTREWPYFHWSPFPSQPLMDFGRYSLTAFWRSCRLPLRPMGRSTSSCVWAGH